MNLLLAVSGGIDSMYLANRAPELYPGARFAVVHCNFALRGEESDADEQFVRSWCEDKGMECIVTRFDTGTHATQNGISIEMAARELRYRWFAQVAAERGADAVVLAHNANDNAETLLLNMLRGTGSRGIRGMAADCMGEYGLRLLRPMLGISREEITGWMKANGHAWREDSTNALSEYKRNMLRNEVFPVFARINPSFVQTLGADMERFAQADDIAEDFYQGIIGSLVDDKGLKVDPLLACKHWQYILWRYLEGASLSWPTFGKLCALLEKFRDSPRGTVTLGSKLFQSHTHCVTIRKGRIISIPKDDE